MKVRENINFERGIDPKRSMDIGLFNFNVEFSGEIENMGDDEKRIAKKWRLGDTIIMKVQGTADEDQCEIDIWLSDGEYIFFESYYETGPSRPENRDFAKILIQSEGTGYIEVKEEFVEELSNGSIILAIMKIYEDVKSGKIINESINFERGIDPKDSMDIGNINARKLKSFYDYAKEFKNFKMGEFKYPDFEFVLEDPGIGIYIKVIITKNPDDKDDFIYHSYNASGSALSNERFGTHFTNLTEFKAVLKHKVGYAMRESLNFERGIDPKVSMKLGIPTWETIKEGDLIECLIKIPLDDTNKINRFYPVADLPKGSILQIEELDDASTKEWTLWYVYYSSMEDYLENNEIDVSNISVGLDAKNRMGYVTGNPHSFRKIFKFLPRSMHESMNFERGNDPKSTMNIGKRNMVEKWLKEMGIFEKCIINKDLTIDAHLAVDFERKGLEGFPEFIQFNKVYGGFNIGGNKFTSLRGCPVRVYETDNFKGNFKCHSNKLTSLEGAPKTIDGNFIAYGNPVKFQRPDVTKVCKVKSGKIWVDELKESIGFQRGGELPLDTLNIGHHSKVLHWFETVINNEMTVFDEGEDFRINKDGTIDLLGDFSMVDRGLESLPDFIKFNIVYGSFYASNNKFTSLDGFPKQVNGDFSIYGTGSSKKWKENEIRKQIKIKGTVWN